jgi:hypothetical protein
MPNLLKTTAVTLSTIPLVVDRLERLVSTGYYGKNTAEAAERLLAETLKALEKAGDVPARPMGSPGKRSRKPSAEGGGGT